MLKDEREEVYALQQLQVGHLVKLYQMITRYIFQNGASIVQNYKDGVFSESEFLEKEINLWLLIAIFIWVIISVREDFLDFFQQILSGFFVGHFIISHNRLEFNGFLSTIGGE